MTTTRNHKSLIRPAAALAAALGLTLTMASPASAAHRGDASSAYGIAAGGLVNVAPVAPSAYDSGLSSNRVLRASGLGLFTTEVLSTTAASTGSTAEVNNTNVTLAPAAGLVPASTLTASVISSSCTIDPTDGSVSGDSSIVDGATSVLGISTTLAANAAPNTTVSVPGIATIILNRQRVSRDGTLTVDAVYISLLNSTQTITIASSSCTPGTVLGVSMLPMSSAVGASLLGLSGFVFFMVRRRQAQQSLIEG